MFMTTTMKKAYFCIKYLLMIQRVQTLFLIISAILIGILFALPFAEIAKDAVVYLFNSKGILLDGVVKQSGFVVIAIITIILAVSVFAIFDFKNRKRQINTILLNIVLKLALLGILVFYSCFLFSGAQISLKVGMVFPLLAIVFDYLAISGIRKDEALIRSIDRIR